MAVDTEQRHWECTKCQETFSQMEHYSAREQKCPKGGTHNLKVVQQSWNNSALGMAVNLVGKGVKAATKQDDEETLRKRQLEQERKLREKQQLANNSMKTFNVVKPYLKFIIPVYLIGFIIAYFLVENKKMVLIIFGVSLACLIYLAYNALINKPKS